MTTEVKAHRIRFYEPDNILIYHAMDYDHKSNRLAVLKKFTASKPSERCVASDIIELIDCSSRCPRTYQRIHDDDSSPNNLETIAWGPENYFFSAGMSGTINQYELDKNLIEASYKVDVAITPIWTISYNHNVNKLAVGTESGLLKVFTWDSAMCSLDFGQKIGVWGERLLSLIWLNDEIVVTGSIEYIAIWSVSKRCYLEKLLVGQGIIVWALGSYGNIIVSGDSTGHTTFWSFLTKSRITSVKSHEKDVLCVAVSRDGIAASSGVDQLMVLFDLKPPVPMKTVHYKLHSHDVKCLTFGADNTVFSGGSDSLLGLTNAKVKSRRKAVRSYFPDLKRNVHSCGQEILLQYRKAIDIYSLEGTEPNKLTAINSKYNILLATFNSSWLIYATKSSLVILERKSNEKGGQYLAKRNHDFTENPLSIDLAVLVDECKLVVTCDKWCFILNLQSKGAECQNPLKFESRITSIHANPSGDFIVCLIDRDVYLSSSSQRNFSLILTLPSPSLDSVYDPSDPNVFWFLNANSTVIKFNIKSKETQEYNLDGSSVDFFKCRNILCLRKVVICYSDDRIFTFSADDLEYRHCISDYKHIISLDMSRSGVQDETRLAITELPPEVMIQKLPASYERHAGTIK